MKKALETLERINLHVDHVSHYGDDVVIVVHAENRELAEAAIIAAGGWRFFLGRVRLGLCYVDVVEIHD